MIYLHPAQTFLENQVIPFDKHSKRQISYNGNKALISVCQHMINISILKAPIGSPAITAGEKAGHLISRKAKRKTRRQDLVRKHL